MWPKRLLIITGLLGIGLFLYLVRGDAAQALELTAAANWWLLLLVVPIQFASYLAQSAYYRSMLAEFDVRVSLRRLYRLVLGLVFANVALPSAGLSGLSLLVYELKKVKVPSGRASFLLLTRYSMTYESYLVFLLGAVGLLYFGNNIASIAIRLTILVAVAIIIATLAGLYAMYDPRAFIWLVRQTQRLVDGLSRRFRGGRELIGARKIDSLLHDFHETFLEVMRRRLYLKAPLGWVLFSNALEVAALYVVFAALGSLINPGIVIIAYAIASASGVLTVLPGDVGVYEATMISILTAAGVPLAVSLSATVLYRLLTKLAVLPVGFYCYRQIIKE